MKNSLNISVAGEDLISTVDDSTNRLFINGTEVPSTSWTGSGIYSTTVNGHAITITQVEDTTGNVAIRRTAAYTYELYKIRTGTTIDGDLIVTGSISEGGVKLEDKYLGGYRSGDEETIVSTASGEPYALIIGGLLTSATKGIYFTIQTPKSMAGVNPSIISLRINPRHSGGGYMIGSSYVSGGTQVISASGYTVTAHKTDDYHITITITRSSAYNGTNNTPCVVQVDELIISFS